eukprot:5545818-Prymnesium_polylepis.1
MCRAPCPSTSPCRRPSGSATSSSSSRRSGRGWSTASSRTAFRMVKAAGRSARSRRRSRTR